MIYGCIEVEQDFFNNVSYAIFIPACSRAFLMATINNTVWQGDDDIFCSVLVLGAYLYVLSLPLYLNISALIGQTDQIRLDRT